MLELCRDCRIAFSFSLTASLEPIKKRTISRGENLGSEENGASRGETVRESRPLRGGEDEGEEVEEGGGSETEARVPSERDGETLRSGSGETSPVRKKMKFERSKEGDTSSDIEEKEKGRVLAVGANEEGRGGGGAAGGDDSEEGGGGGERGEEKEKDYEYTIRGGGDDEIGTGNTEDSVDMIDRHSTKHEIKSVTEISSSSSSSSLLLSDDTLKEPQAENEIIVCTNSSTPVCSGCLGLLDDAFLDELCTSVSESLTKSGYQNLDSFSLSLSTPLSLIIRQSAVLFYLKENFEITEEPMPAYVKETLRQKLYVKLKDKLSPLRINIESRFQVVLKFDHFNCITECKLMANIWPSPFAEQRKRRRWWRRRGRGRGRDTEPVGLEFNIGNVTNALSNATASDFEENDFLSTRGHQCSYSVDFLHSQIWIGGRYCKYSRELSQTPWFVDGVRKAETSVQELICPPIESLVGCSQLKFSSSGREDCDVRMLGNGRPFLLELINPKKSLLTQEEMHDLESRINSSTELIKVKKLTMMVKSDASLLKEGEAEKRKEYRALVRAPQEMTQKDIDCLEEMGEVILQQKTPIRVLHRRVMAVRERTVYSMKAKLKDEGGEEDGHHFFLDLTTQAGTYIKEFVHGDLGRTRPNLRMILGQEVDIISLDVLEVLLEWPPAPEAAAVEDGPRPSPMT